MLIKNNPNCYLIIVSNYAGQKEDREYELKWNEFLIQQTKKLLLK